MVKIDKNPPSNHNNSKELSDQSKSQCYILGYLFYYLFRWPEYVFYDMPDCGLC